MLNVQNEYVNGNIAQKISVEKLNPKLSADKPENTENTVVNRDTFEHSVSENLFTYSPETISRNENTASTTAATTTSYATTDIQKRNIPVSLAAKMAGLRIDSNGTPVVTGKYDYEALQRAQLTISGNHKKLSYNSTYCYSQTDSKENYGFSNPRQECATYAFATALSIKNGRKITPDQAASGPYNEGSFSKDNVKTWNWSGETAYRIRCTSNSEAFSMVDAQLQLGNPVLIHVASADTDPSNQHWATIIGKENGQYTIIDPWDGKEHTLDQMQKNDGINKFTDVVILTNKY